MTLTNENRHRPWAITNMTKVHAADISPAPKRLWSQLCLSPYSHVVSLPKGVSV